MADILRTYKNTGLLYTDDKQLTANQLHILIPLNTTAIFPATTYSNKYVSTCQSVKYAT